MSMFRLYASVGLVCLFSSPVLLADTKIEIAKCAEEPANAKRLICFDNLANSLGVDGPQKKVIRGNGKWDVSVDTSPVDDSKTVTLSLLAEDTIKGRFNYKEVAPILILRCQENTTEVFISWRVFIGSSTASVLTRVDKKKAVTKKWSLSTDNKATFSPKGISFIKGLFGHSKLLSQVTPYGANPVMATFDISGIDEAIKPLRKTCSW